MSRQRVKPVFLILAVIGVMAFVTGAADALPRLPDRTAAPNARNVLRIAQTAAAPDPFDPALIFSSPSIGLSQNTFDGLVDIDSNFKLTKALARSWTVSKNGLTYTFQLRRGAKFQNGKTVTAADFVYTINRSLDPKVAAPNSFLLSDIAGSTDVLAGRSKAADVHAVGKYALRIKLSHSAGYFPALISRWPAWVVDRNVIERYGTSWFKPPNVVGTGAYRLANRLGDDRFEFVANKRYWGKKASIPRVVVTILRDSTAALARYQAGEFDVVTGLAAPTVQQVVGDRKLKPQFHARGIPRTIWLGMDTSRPPFDDKRVRLAINHGIDRKALVRIGLANQGLPASAWLPPGIPGNLAGKWKGYAYSPGQARTLLSQAGYPGGRGFPELELAYSTQQADVSEQALQFVQAQLEQNLGIKLTLKNSTITALRTRLGTPSQRPRIWVWGLGYSYPEAQQGDQYLAITGAPFNYESYKNPIFDSLVRQAFNTTNPAKRSDLYRRAERIRLGDAPVVPLYNPIATWVSKPYVRGFRLGAAGPIKFNAVTLR